MKIARVLAREILASGGMPSVEVKVTLDSGAVGVASVSYGASAGSKEAAVLHDWDKHRYGGKGMLKAVDNVNNILSQVVVGMDAEDQRAIDETLIREDGTEKKSNLGANAILGVSMATARATAISQNLALHQYLQKVFNIPLPAEKTGGKLRLPKPMAVLIEGGKHADNSTDLQEYILAVTREQAAKKNVQMMEEIYQALKNILKRDGRSINVGNEGAFAPEGIADNELPIKYIVQAIGEAGYEAGVDAGVALDAAASEFYKDGKYELKTENKILSASELMDMYLAWQDQYPLVSWEDMFSEFDWDYWAKFKVKSKIPVVADDLTVTNVALLQKAINHKVADAILIKLNQAGTVTETVDCCLLANQHNFLTIPSHRGGGETNDTFLVDLAVAVGSQWIKVGPTRGERVCKYNRLMEIEEQLN